MWDDPFDGCRVLPVLQRFPRHARSACMARLAESLNFVKTVARVMYEFDIKYPATALAYYTFVSFVPLLLLVFAVVGRQFALEVYTRAPRFVTPDMQQILYEAVTTASGRVGAAVLAVVALAWSGANVAIGFLTVVERVEATTTERPLAIQVRDATVVLVTLGLAMLALILLSALLAVLAAGFLGVLVGFVVLLGVLTVTFLPLYYVPSRVVGSVPAAFPGALTTACGWTVIHAGVQFYAANAAQYAIYGVLSGIIIILTSSYLAAVILMMGVVVNTVFASDTDALLANGVELS